MKTFLLFYVVNDYHNKIHLSIYYLSDIMSYDLRQEKIKTNKTTQLQIRVL
uniref:Uncharacterized protein n=1 Tax=Bartonella schoenbuchensis (strain DSM 13525 / NCTC 13165 / R1) TaxID=687861 RepID=E6YZD6_BARSR|nr:hypothetical protein B11C_40079 [Bartonella schoenbuchensis R1]